MIPAWTFCRARIDQRAGWRDIQAVLLWRREERAAPADHSSAAARTGPGRPRARREYFLLRRGPRCPSAVREQAQRGNELRDGRLQSIEARDRLWNPALESHGFEIGRRLNDERGPRSERAFSAWAAARMRAGSASSTAARIAATREGQSSRNRLTISSRSSRSPSVCRSRTEGSKTGGGSSTVRLPPYRRRASLRRRGPFPVFRSTAGRCCD